MAGKRRTKVSTILTQTSLRTTERPVTTLFTRQQYTKPDEVLASEREDKVREKVFRIDRPENTAALCVPFILNRKYIGTVSIYNCPFSLTSLKQVQRQKMRSQNQEQDGDIDCKQQ